MTTSNQVVRFLTANQVCERFGGISPMTLWRWLKSETLAFPRPMVVNRHRLFREEEIAAWEARQAGEKDAAA
jgi:predicted DNA-binding transcriptional regulator AlpA